MSSFTENLVHKIRYFLYTRPLAQILTRPEICIHKTTSICIKMTE